MEGTENDAASFLSYFSDKTTLSIVWSFHVISVAGFHDGNSPANPLFYQKFHFAHFNQLE